MKIVTTPQQAVDEYMGEQFIEWLQSHISHEVNSWPTLVKLAQSGVKPEKLRKFMMQIFHAADAFIGGKAGDPGFLRFAIANLSESDDPAAEAALEILEKKRHEELSGHKAERGMIQTIKRGSWFKLLEALGVSSEEIEKSEPKEQTRKYVAELSDIYSNSEWQTAMGAYAAQAMAENEEYKALEALLKKNDPAGKALEIISKIAPDQKSLQSASRVLDKISFDPESKNLVWDGVVRQLTIRRDFFANLEKYLI